MRRFALQAEERTRPEAGEAPRGLCNPQEQPGPEEPRHRLDSVLFLFISGLVTTLDADRKTAGDKTLKDAKLYLATISALSSIFAEDPAVAKNFQEKLKSKGGVFGSLPVAVQEALGQLSAQALEIK
jgi:hypothetical protein